MRVEGDIRLSVPPLLRHCHTLIRESLYLGGLLNIKIMLPSSEKGLEGL
jgi:hypothetical protein